MTDPQYSDAVLREQLRELTPAHDHDPASCPECKERVTAEHERLERHHAHAPRDRSLKYPRRTR
jgi:uncharacterized protein YlaI